MKHKNIGSSFDDFLKDEGILEDVEKGARNRIRHKFNAVRTEYDGIRFDSKKEGRYYLELKLKKKAGLVLFWLRQVGFDLPGNTKYRCDFQVFMTDGTVEFIDVKGMRTPQYILKRKQVEALYPITIKEA